MAAAGAIISWGWATGSMGGRAAIIIGAAVMTGAAPKVTVGKAWAAKGAPNDIGGAIATWPGIAIWWRLVTGATDTIGTPAAAATDVAEELITEYLAILALRSSYNKIVKILRLFYNKYK